MNPRTYATRFLLIMTGILGFAAAQGPIYAGTLCECVTNFTAKRTCFDANTGDVDLVVFSRGGTNQRQCEIRSGNARLFLVADFQGSRKDPQNLNFKCTISITGLPACNGFAQVNNLSQKDQASWRSLARSECRAAE